jgi:hypothetical protein
LGLWLEYIGGRGGIANDIGIAKEEKIKLIL